MRKQARSRTVLHVLVRGAVAVIALPLQTFCDHLPSLRAIIQRCTSACPLRASVLQRRLFVQGFPTHVIIPFHMAIA